MNRNQAVILVFLLVLVFSSFLYYQFSQQREMNTAELENVELRFSTTEIDNIEAVDLNILRYSDATYLDLSIIITNNADHEIALKNPMLTLYIGNAFVHEMNLGDITVPAKGSSTMKIEDVSVKTEILSEALKGRMERLEDTIEFNAVLSPEYSFDARNITLVTYRLQTTFEGTILLKQVFGGKSQEEAAEEILGLK
jgi:hypothetical protein